MGGLKVACAFWLACFLVGRAEELAIAFDNIWDELDEGSPNAGVAIGRFEPSGELNNCTECTNDYYNANAGGVCYRNIIDSAPTVPIPQTSGDNAVLPRRDITVEAWVRLKTTFGEMFQSSLVSCMRGHFPIKSGSEFDYGFNLGFTDGYLYFGLSTRGGSNAMNNPVLLGPPIYAFNPERWYHFAGTYDGTYRRLYVDGVLWGSVEQPGNAILYPPCQLALGGSRGCFKSSFFPGNFLAEVRLWNIARSQEDLVRDSLVRYNTSELKTQPGLIGLWQQLDETGHLVASLCPRPTTLLLLP